ncbi:MAG: circadian clock KaiB family protein [Phycisphaeraceae bacterium]
MTEARGERQVCRLILFVAGREANSTRARENLDRIRGTYLNGRCELQIIDVLEDYRTALRHKVLVTPCLVMTEPGPPVQIAGTLHDEEKVRAALRLPSE